MKQNNQSQIGNPFFLKKYNKSTPQDNKMFSPISNEIRINTLSTSHSKPNKNINILFLDSSIPNSQSRELSIQNRLFSAETPINPPKLKRIVKNFPRPLTSIIKMKTLNDDIKDNFEEMSQSSVSVHVNHKIEKKPKKIEPFETTSQFTKLQNESFLSKMRVLSAISRKTDTLIFEVSKNDKLDECIEKENQENGIIVPKTDESEIFGMVYFLLYYQYIIIFSKRIKRRIK